LADNDEQVVVGNDTTQFVQGPGNEYNPEISFRTQFNTPVAPNYTYLYNRSGAPITGSAASANNITQPRFRFGMQPAHDLTQPVPNGPFASPDLSYLAGVPAQIVQGAPFIKPYPNIFDDLNQYNNAQWAHNLYDMNDLVLTDVVSFEVKVLWEGGPGPQSYYYIPTGLAAPNNYQPVKNTDFPYDYLPLSPYNQVFSGLGVGVFDTWSQHGPYGQIQGGAPPGDQPNWKRTDLTGANSAMQLPLRVKAKALLIRFRIWDQKAEQTRQITIYQDV
jgi:hypothetical protein